MRITPQPQCVGEVRRGARGAAGGRMRITRAGRRAPPRIDDPPPDGAGRRTRIGLCRTGRRRDLPRSAGAAATRAASTRTDHCSRTCAWGDNRCEGRPVLRRLQGPRARRHGCSIGRSSSLEPAGRMKHGRRSRGEALRWRAEQPARAPAGGDEHEEVPAAQPNLCAVRCVWKASRGSTSHRRAEEDQAGSGEAAISDRTRPLVSAIPCRRDPLIRAR